MEKIEATYLSAFDFIERKWGDIKNGFTHFSDGDVAVAKITPCFQNRKSMILKNLPNGIGAGTTELKVLRAYGSTILAEYLLYFLESAYFVEEATFKGTANQQRIISGYLENKLFPLPPIAEQLRITAKIVELLPICDRFIKSQTSLDKLNKELNANIRKSILQEAIQGLLVPQIASEGTAEELLAEIRAEKMRLVKEGKLKKSALANESRIFRGEDNRYYENINGVIHCIDEEIPFAIPETWVWVRLDDICSYIQRGKSPKYSLVKQIPVVAQKCNQWSGFQIEKAQFIEPSTMSSYGEERKLQDGDLMWNSTGIGTLGRMAIYWEKLNPYGIAVADSHVTVIRPCAKVSSKYLFAYFSSHTVQSVIEDKSDGSTKQKELSTTTVRTYLVPFPPYLEQQRIVSKIDEALAGIMSR